MLFTDLADSTSILSALGDTAGEHFLQQHLTLLRDAVGAFRGHEVKNLGDGLMAVFDDPADAVLCAVEMQRKVRQDNGKGGHPHVGLRVGLHAGDVTCRDGDFFGLTVVTASRLCARAAGGESLATAAMLAETGLAIECEDRGPLQLKGLADPVPTVALHDLGGSVFTLPVQERRWEAADAPYSRLRSTPLVGRRQELALLEERLRSVEGCRVVLLTGEPGIGKSRLVAEVAARATSAATVHWGECTEEALAAYQPFRQALGDWPEFGEDRMVAFAEVGRLFDRTPGPALLVIDDLPWADAGSLQLLEHLVRDHSRRLLVVATARSDELGPDLPHTLTKLHRLHALEYVELGGLAVDEVTEMARGWAGHPISGRLARTLHDRTGGNAFFVEEWLRTLLAAGHLDTGDGSLVLAPGAPMPRSVSEVALDRLRHLDPAHLELLTTAAVLGNRFEVSALEALVDGDPDAILDALEAGCAARLLREDSEDPETLHFSSTVLRDALSQRLIPLRRRRLHAQAAALLQRDADPALAGALAQHLRAAGAPSPDVLASCLAAADYARSELAWEDAARHLAAALEVEGVLADQVRPRLLNDLGDALWASGDLAEARAAYQRAAWVAEQGPRPVELARAALGFAGRMGFRLPDADEQVTSLLERSLSVLGDDQPGLRAQVLAQLAESSLTTMRYEHRKALCAEAESLARGTGDPAVLAAVLRRCIWAQWSPHNPELRLTRSQELLDLAEQIGERRTAIEARMTALAANLELGMPPTKIDEVIDELEEKVQQSGEPYDRWLLLVTRANRALYDQGADEAERLAREAGAAVSFRAHPAALEILGNQLAYVGFLRGRMAPLRAGLEDYSEVRPALNYRLALALAHAESGHLAPARELVDELARDGFAAVGEDAHWLATMNQLTTIINDLSATEAARLLYDKVEPLAGAFCTLGAFGTPSCSMQRHLGVLALLSDRADLAVQHLEQSLELNRDNGAVTSVAMSDHDLAQALIARGTPADLARAETVLAECVEISTQLHLDRYVHRAAGLQARLRGERPDLGPAPQVRPLQRVRAGVSTRARAWLGRRTPDLEDARLGRYLGSPAAQRTVLTSLAMSFQPTMACGFTGEVEVVLDPEEPGPATWWTLDVRASRIAVRSGPARFPATSLRCRGAVLLRLFSGELNPVTAMLSGEVEVSGDVFLAARLREMLGGVTPIADRTWQLASGVPELAEVSS